MVAHRIPPRRERKDGIDRMPLIPLKAFHLIAGLRSFSKAARELGISQPAVTQQIRRLERNLGQRLFDRVGRGVLVTDAGRMLDTYAQRIFHLLDAAGDAMDNLAGLRTGRLEVGASRTAGAYYIPEALDRFKRKYPGVRVSLTVGNSETILAKVLDFRLHAGLIAGPYAHPHIAAVPLIRDRVLVVLPSGHRLGRKPVVTIEDLHRYPVILREPGSATRRLIERAFQSEGLDVTPAMELESNEAIKSAVADGIGVGLLAQAAVAQEIASGRLVARPLRDPLYLDFFLVYHRDRTVSPVVAAFLALLPPPPATSPGRVGALPEGSRSRALNDTLRRRRVRRPAGRDRG
jgi:LysR family transcriptional regulator, low CO2-responsive transcriptional regulator